MDPMARCELCVFDLARSKKAADPRLAAALYKAV